MHSWGAFNLTVSITGATLDKETRAPLPRQEVREPVWSLSVEDPLPWRRLYSATSAVSTLVWSRKCAVSSSASVISRQSSPRLQAQNDARRASRDEAFTRLQDREPALT